MSDTPSQALTVVVVDRQRWYRGHVPMTSRLRIVASPADRGARVPEMFIGHQCCLGFACEAKGIEGDALNDIAFPDALHDVHVPEGVRNWAYDNRSLFRRIGEVNDNRDLTDAQREAKLKELGPSIGVDFQFIN